MPITQAAGSVFMGVHPTNVDAVLVDGRFVKRDGKLVGMNLALLRADSESLGDGLFRKIGTAVGRWIPDLS